MLNPAEITPGTLASPSTSQRSAIQAEPGVPAGMTSYFPMHTVGNDPAAFHLALERAQAMPQVSLGALLASNVLIAPSPRQPEIPIDTHIPNPPDPNMAPSSQFWFPPFGEMDPGLPGGIDPGYPGMHPGIAPEQFSGWLFPGLNVGHLPTPTLSSRPLGEPERGVQATPRSQSQAQAGLTPQPLSTDALAGGLQIAGSDETRQATSFAQHQQFSHQFGPQPPHAEGTSIPTFNTAQPSSAGQIPSSLQISSTTNFYFGNNGYPFNLLSPSQLPQAGSGYGAEQQQQHQAQLARNPSAAQASSFSQFSPGGGYDGGVGGLQSHTQFDMNSAAPVMTPSQYQSALLSRGLQTPASASGQQPMWNGPPQPSYLAAAAAASSRPPLPQRKVSDPELFMRQIQRAGDATWQGPSGGFVLRNPSALTSRMNMRALSGVGALANDRIKSPDEQGTTSLFQAASAPVPGVYLAGGARQFMGLNNGRPPALSASVADEAMMRDYFSALK
ncbi:hypothetical protein M427DRAFT_325590 [Gonapodya prolifera JEL478]|uniref:Uncharacterized protein n=1 Tax=Gonapodya prolifera (strain JEL478) TaxID=1344416 RepID=A0A139AF75_GONPJ|nr:hypothetical protein M427DRAFT_325590 [Gonapodya prolifera JEL478]|eukprot:KXS15466.1 hypothetical protein M427DRAFT_325590 [Gonapodya prolifera JEL478]